MKVNWKYMLFLSSIIILYFALLYYMPRRFNWLVTLYQGDKNPFGAYVLKALLDESWLEDVTTSNKTLFELRHLQEHSLLILCERFETSSADRESLLQRISEGHNVLISSNRMDTAFANLLGVEINQLSISFYTDAIWALDSIGFRFTGSWGDSTSYYWLPRQMLSQYFESYDASTTHVLAENSDGNPVLLRVETPSGPLFLSSTPLVFTNYSMVHANNYDFVAATLALLGGGSLHWSEFYQLGRMESTTPLRYVLSEPSLKWALYLLMCSILVFILFEMKRKQRVIPVILPLKNQSLDFVKTIARLYYLRKDHRNLALKKILHTTDVLQRNYNIDLDEDLEDTITRISAKTGTEVAVVRSFVMLINDINSASHITSAKLNQLVDLVDEIIKN